MSDEISLSQGVRQGSILSPHLYNLYTEELLRELQSSSKSGTSLYGHYTGIVMYADDIILMSTTLAGLQKLVNSCVTVSNKNCISFNYEKTEFCTSKSNLGNNTYITMSGFTIKPKSNLKHLGFLWNDKNNIHNNIKNRTNKFWSVIQAQIKGAIRFCHPSTIKQLYASQAIPALSYGIELNNLTDTLLNKLNVETRKGLKTLFNISTYSKNYLNTLLNIEHFSTIVIRNKLNLLIRLLNNKKNS